MYGSIEGFSFLLRCVWEKRKGKGKEKKEKYFKCFAYKKKRARKWLISGPAFKTLVLSPFPLNFSS